MQVLDKGFVELIDHMGNDLTTVNAARVSFGKRKEVFDDKDAGLIEYLADHEHTSPFRHSYLTFHVKAPIFVMRQWMKHRISSEFNELSGRYVEFEPEYYVPEVFRSQSKDLKQGSDGVCQDQKTKSGIFADAIGETFNAYYHLLASGVCKEQARMVLPLALYTEVYWTASLQAVAHFIKQRTDSHAQWEIQQYASAVKELTMPLFPHSLAALLEVK